MRNTNGTSQKNCPSGPRQATNNYQYLKICEKFKKLFDTDRKQYFDANDLDRVMRSLGEHLTEEQIKDMIGEVDCQGDARVNRDEFLEMMCNF